MNRWFDHIPFISKYVPGKIVLSFLMLVLSVVLGIVFKTYDRAICICAMLFSFIGDYELNHYPKKGEDHKRNFIKGGVFFIAAHLSYFFAYSLKIYKNNLEWFNGGTVFALCILALVVLVFMSRIKEVENKKLFYYGLIYLLLTGINYEVVFTYSVSVKSIESLAMMGGILFLGSDIIIGFERFLGLKSKLCRELVWWFYPIGQILLICMA